MTQNLYRTATCILAALCFHLNPKTADATIDEVTLGATSVWSNWYWPRKNTLNPNMYDNGECMARYDDYDIPSGESAQTWEADPDNHGDYSGVEEWQGHCHAWSAAAIWEPQPTFAETHSGVEFRIRDKKALLTEIYIDALKQENRQFAADYPTPGKVWRMLRKEIRGIQPTGGVAKPVIMDLAPNSYEEWNYPVFRYKVDHSGASPNISGNMWFYIALDGEASFADDTASHYQITQAYSFKDVAFDASNEPIESSGTWTTTFLPPSRVWRPLSNEAACVDPGENPMTCMSGNPHLEQEYLRVILDVCTGSSLYADVDATANGTGTLLKPFKTVSEGVAEVCDYGTLNIVAGTYNEKLRITKKMRLKNAAGAVSIKGN